MAQTHRVILFGDQSNDIEDSLRSLLKCSDTLVIDFFQKAYHNIRREVGQLPPHLRDAFPRFTSIADLLSRKLNGLIHPAVEQYLCLSNALGSFIREHSAATSPYPSPASAHLIGVCTGALAAAAISASRNILELLPNAIDALTVAFRIGMRTAEVASSLAGSDKDLEWSLVVAGLGHDEVNSRIGDFVKRHPLPIASQPYVSACSSNSTTVSGPPSVLAELRPVLATSSIATLPIYAAYHAPHLYSEDDITNALSSVSAALATEHGVPVLSCGTGQPVYASGLRTHLEQAARDVLLRPITLEKAVDSLAILLSGRPQTQIQITAVGMASGESFRRHLGQALSAMNIPAELTVAQPTIPPISPAGLPDSRGGRSKIAVIGTGGRFPGAASPEALWDLLMRKQDMCEEVPAMRWDVNTHVDPTGKRKNTSKIRWGCWLDEPDKFDAKFFNMSPREAPQVDPAMRLALITAYEAMEQAGVVPGRTSSTREDRVGVFFGTTSNDWCETNSGQDVDCHYIPGANRAFIPGRINYFFKFSGPSYSVDTACSSSLSALHIACNSLWRGDVDMAITGGTNVLTNPNMHAGLDRGHFLSATGNCKTFDADADGYCRGEGVATLLLKRLEDAIEDDDPILGVVSSAYTNHSAEAESITRPHVGAQKDIFERVLNDSGTASHEISYVEMHGTGTQAGDSREMQSVSDTLAPEHPKRRRTADQALYLGALKANIGHGEAVSGVSALIKVLKMMEMNTIPPNCGIKGTINPKFPSNLAERQVNIPVEPTAWRSTPGRPRKAIINNFSAAGGNSSVLVEEYQKPTAPACTNNMITDQRRCFPVALSARCPASLKGNIKSLMDFLNSSNSHQVDLAQLSYTTTARRMHHPHRVIVSGSSLDEIKIELNHALGGDVGAKRSIPTKSMLFAFTGQGSQYPGMAKQLLGSHSVFRRYLEHFDTLAQRSSFPSILPLFAGTAGTDISDYSPVVVQLANVCMQIALARLWMSWGITPTAVVGHSLGEYAALNIAGVLSDIDTIFIVGQRARLLEQKCQRGTHAMLAVLTSVANVQQITRGSTCEVACVNGAEETVIAGTTEKMTRLQQQFTSAGIKCTLLRTPYAFHSAQISTVKDDILDAAQACKFRTPTMPVLSPLLAAVVRDAPTFCPDYVARHAREPVNFMQCLQVAAKEGVIGDSTIAIEFGPHPVVSGMIKATLGPNIDTLPTLRRNKDSWETLTQTLSALYAAGATIKWDEYYRDMPNARTVLNLPKYSWDMQSYWIKYKNDWTLTTADYAFDKSSIPALAPASQLVQRPATTPMPMVDQSVKLESTSVHKIVREENSVNKCTIIVDTDVARPDIAPMMAGHTVEGIGLCTPSVYADIGFTIGNYILKKYEPAFSEKIVDVGDMEIDKALIAGTTIGMYYLRTSVELDWASKYAKVVYSTVDANGTEVVKHATASISFRNEINLHEVKTKLTSEKVRYEAMRNACSSGGKTFRFNGPMAYNMVSALADFHKDYRCIDETIYDNENWEAACTVSFGQMKQGGDFHTHPGALDGLTQSCGFIMNANESTNLETDVFVNHGWDSFQIYETIRHDCQYQTHVKMSPAENKQWKGDIAVWSGERVVASIKGCCLQGVPRRVLKYILNTSHGAPKAKGAKPKAQATPAAAPAPAPAPQAQAPGPATITPPMTPPSVAVAAPASAPQQQQQTVTLPQAQIAAPQPSSNSGQAVRALEIIAEQSGVPLADLKDDSVLADIGVDSLLSLTITGAFAEELELDVDSTFLEEHPTIGHVKRYFASLEPEAAGSVPIVPPSRVATPLLPAEYEPAAPATPFQPAPAAVVPQAQAPASSPVLARVDSGMLDYSSKPITPISEPPASSGEDSLVPKALKIISEESGLEVADLKDDTSLLDAGVDSLLALVVGGRFREELDIDIEADELLSACETVGQLKQAIGTQDTISNAPATLTPPQVDVDEITFVPTMPVERPTQPEPQVQRVQFALEMPTAPELPQAHTTTTGGSFAEACRGQASSIPNDDRFEDVLAILCEETQIEPAGITEETLLADVGVDSLISLVISGRLRDELDLDLGADNELVNFATVRDLKQAIIGGNEGTSTPGSTASVDSGFSIAFTTPGASQACTPFTEVDEADAFDASFKLAQPQPAFIPSATSVALQGSSKTATNILWLFPDGSGSATSYVDIPRIAPNLVVYGLNSPYLKKADQMPHNFQDLITSYLAEVRRRQPHGPYHFAGWSAGGALAFRSAQVLIQAGEKISSLVLLDAPVPMGLGELPQRLYDYFEKNGVFKSQGKKEAPKWLIPHFKAVTRALHTYHASPMPYAAVPKVKILWASRGVIESVNAPPFELQPGDNDDIRFLTETRTDFSAGHWGRLLPGCEIAIDKVDGGDHFEMMHVRWAAKIATFLADVF